MDLRALEGRIAKLEAELSSLISKTAGVSGVPVIKAHHGARLDLNENLDVVRLNGRLARIEEWITKQTGV